MGKWTDQQHREAAERLLASIEASPSFPMDAAWDTMALVALCHAILGKR